MTEKDAVEKRINWARVVFSIIYAIVAIGLFLIFRDTMFYFKAEDNSWNIHRFIWCCIAVSLGFAAIAFGLRHHTRSPLPEYLTHYPFQIVAMAALVFGSLHIFEATSGYLFYYLSFGLCFTLGYLVDSYWSFIMTVVGRANK